ncbi:MAG: exodeoxyribonuclease III [Hyphomicrobium aestuarii]|nr:exodeoxyribonuclease III [Hyphomicrobium aestuarii]
MKLATWNINGVKARIETALAWLDLEKPDVVCLQEIKSVDEGFPAADFENLGYTVVTHGQKGFNGVAILSKLPIEDVMRGLPGDDGDVQARYIEATIAPQVMSGLANGGGQAAVGQAAVGQAGFGRAIRLGCLYLPNGNPLGTEKFPYKLGWMARLETHARRLLNGEMPVVLAGDYNVIAEPADAKRPEVWTGDALYQPESRAAWRRLVNLGYTDAVRACHPEPGIYTFWDYQAGAFQKNDGIRIDHILLSPQAAGLLRSAMVAKDARAMEKPSDHVPVVVDLG